MSNTPPVDNPYAAPLSASATRGSSADEETRNQYLNHEASVQSIGFLYLLGGALVAISGMSYIAIGISGETLPQFGRLKVFMLGLGIFCLLLSGLQIYAAVSVRKLRNAGRIIVTVFTAIGLITIPLVAFEVISILIGTLISGYILYLLWSPKGNFIFTPEYQRVLKATPHIKYKTSIVVWILLGLVLLLIGFAIFGAFVSIPTKP